MIVMAKNTTNYVTVDSLVFVDNVRDDYCLNLPGMVESIKRHGFKVNHPLVVSKKEDGTNLVLIGNRRGMSLHWLRDNDPAAYDKALGELPAGKIPAVVHEGLTASEEVLLRIDHSTDEDREPLNEWSVCRAVKQLVQIGHDTQDQIATKLGLFHTKGKKVGQPNRSVVQPRVDLASLPQFVQDEMEKYCLDHSSTPLGWAKIPGLAKANRKEFKDYPNSDGPEFIAAWKAAMTPKEKADKSELVGKALSPASALKRAQSCASNGVRDALLSATNQSALTIPEIDKAVALAEASHNTLLKIREHFGDEEYQGLLEEVFTAVA